jgi:hypothetical protein
MSTTQKSADLASEWLRSVSIKSGDIDPLADMYEYARVRLIQRDGFIPSHRTSRNGSVDSTATANRDEVLRQVAEELRKSNTDYASSYIREWIDSSDDPNGILFECSSSVGTSRSGLPLVSSTIPTPAGIRGSDFQISLPELLDWDYDFLAQSVPVLTKRATQIFSEWGFLTNPDILGGISKDKFQSFVRAISRNYRSENSYHNFHHAVSVLAVSGNLLLNCTPGVFTSVEEFAILIAALCHDVGHRGLNSDYYIKTRHGLAIQYNDASVLENMHCSLSFELLRSTRNDFTKPWPDDQYTVFRKTFIQSVLATDMKQHFELTAKLGEIRASVVALESSTPHPELKRNIYSAIVHAADLSNPTMHPKHSYNWAYRVVEEMYAQGQLEEQAGFTAAPFMKHHPSETVEFAKLQVSFVNFIVTPLWKGMAGIWPVIEPRLELLRQNGEFWESIRDASPEEAKEKIQTLLDI